MTPSDLRSYRTGLGLSTRAFGLMVGVTSRTVRRWEAGDQAFPEMLDKLIAARDAVEKGRVA